MDQNTRAPEYGEARELSRKADFVAVSSLDEDSFPETRLMFNLRRHRQEALDSGEAALPADFDTYLGTNASSRKVAQFRRDPRICLYYSDNQSFQGLSLRGVLEEVGDKRVKKAVWTPEWEMYYPGGLEGGDFSLFRFKPRVARYYHGLRVVEFGF